MAFLSSIYLPILVFGTFYSLGLAFLIWSTED